MIYQHPEKFGGHEHCESEDLLLCISHLNLKPNCLNGHVTV